MQANDFSINKNRFMEHLAELFLELRHVKIHCERCYGTKSFIKLNKPRSLIEVNEIVMYVDYKTKELSEVDLIEPKLDHAIRTWVKSATNSGIHYISFDKEEASKNPNSKYFYDIFS